MERDIERGDFNSALRRIDLSLRLSRDLRPRAPILQQILADVLDVIVLERQLTPALKSPALTARHCDALLQILLQHTTAVRSSNPFLTGLRGDYLAKRMLLQDLQQHTGEFAETRYRQAFDTPHETRAAVLFTALNGTSKQRDAFGLQPPAPLQRP